MLIVTGSLSLPFAVSFFVSDGLGDAFAEFEVLEFPLLALFEAEPPPQPLKMIAVIAMNISDLIYSPV
jgi:hypothetical protein